MASKVRSKAAAGRPRGPAAAPAAAVRRWSDGWVWLFALAGILTVIAFAPSLGGGFVFDDLHLPFADPHAAEMPPAFWIGGVRPVLVATYWANFLVSGMRPFSYHLVNLLLHATTGVLVYFVFDRILDLAGWAADRRRWYALFGAALFLIHPLQTESVDYVAGRSEVVAGLLVFAAWLVFLRSFESDIGIAKVIAILVLTGAAVLGKENAICLPALLISTDLFWAKAGIATQLRKRLKLYVPFILGGTAAALFILRRLMAGGGNGGAGASAGVTGFSYALTQCKVIPIYIRLFLFPVGQNGDWQLPFFKSVAADGAWIWVLAFAAFCAGIVWLYRRDRLAAFGLTVFLLALGPTSSFVPIKDALAERRLYIPISGLILTAMALSARIRISAETRRWTAVGVLAVAALLTWHRSEVWVSDFTFWTDALAKNSGNARAYYGLGVALMQRHEYAKAVAAFSSAHSKDPDNGQIAFDLAAAYQMNKQPGLALPILRKIVTKQPAARIYNLIGYLEALQGHPVEAMDAIEASLRLDPNNSLAYAYRGLVKMARNQNEEAAVDFQKALEIDPGNTVAANGMSQLERKP